MTDNRGGDGDPTDNRNGRLSAPRAEDGTYRSVSGHYARPPSCDGCDRKLGQAETVWRVTSTRRAWMGWGTVYVVYGECCREEPPDWRYPDHPVSCDGCDRTVFHERDHRRRKYIWCSTECRRHNEARVRRARRRKGLTCATCGESFDASRSDAKYCTDACRQKAYRERRGEEEAEA